MPKTNEKAKIFELEASPELFLEPLEELTEELDGFLRVPPQSYRDAMYDEREYRRLPAHLQTQYN